VVCFARIVDKSDISISRVFRRDRWRCARLEGVTFHLRIYKNETRARRLILPPFSGMSFLRGTIVTCRRSSDTFFQGKTLEMGFFGSREYTEPMLGRQGSSRWWNGLALTSQCLRLRVVPLTPKQIENGNWSFEVRATTRP